MAADEYICSRKRIADREINKHDQHPQVVPTDEPEMDSFQRASDEVMSTRRIIQVGENQPRSDSNTPSDEKLLSSSDAGAGVSEEQEEG
jgi:NUP50 (Nucleoporin 50 kDa)